jgi:hypothetical protein
MLQAEGGLPIIGKADILNFEHKKDTPYYLADMGCLF